VIREAASYDLDLEMLEAAYGAFMNATTFSNKPDLYRPLQEACGALVTWLKVCQLWCAAGVCMHRQSGVAAGMAVLF
jgi:hypothetical protein